MITAKRKSVLKKLAIGKGRNFFHPQMSPVKIVDSRSSNPLRTYWITGPEITSIRDKLDAFVDRDNVKRIDHVLQLVDPQPYGGATLITVIVFYEPFSRF